MRRAGFAVAGIAFVLLVGTGTAQAAPGDLDHSFSGDGRALTSVGSGFDDAWDIAVQSDGKAVVVGSTGADFQHTAWAIVRYRSNGSLDPTFGGDGKVTTGWTPGDDEAYAVRVLPSGKLLVAGQAGGALGVARYTKTGTLDTTFGGGDGKVVANLTAGQDAGWDIDVLPNGQFLVGGEANGDAAVVKFGPKGGLVHSFGTNGAATVHSHNGSLFGRALAVQGNGKILETGFIQGTGGNFAILLARFTSNGEPDTAFGGTHEGFVVALEGENGQGWALEALPGGATLVAGSGQAGSAPDSPDDGALVKFTSTGDQDPTYGGGDGVASFDLGGSEEFVLAASFLPSGKIVVAGASGQAGAQDHAVVARVKADGSLDHTFSGDGVAEPGFADNSQFWGVAVDSSNRVVAAGFHANGIVPDQFAVARFLG